MKPKDFKGNYKVKVKKDSLPACTDCLPAAPLDGHPTFNGIMVHSRVDCPPNQIYMLNESSWRKR